MNLPDAHTHSSTAASGTAPRFICGTSPADWKQVALLAERDEHVTPFFGIHPWFLNPAEWKEEMPRLESLLQKSPMRALGKRGWTNAGAASRGCLSRRKRWNVIWNWPRVWTAPLPCTAAAHGAHWRKC